MRRLILALALFLALAGGLGEAQAPCLTPEQAAMRVGEYGCVTGRVSRVFWAQQSSGRPTFVDLGRSFTVVIWEEDRAKFAPAPEQWQGATITVWGRIQTYQGRAEIVLRDPAQFAPPPRAAAPPPAPVERPAQPALAPRPPVQATPALAPTAPPTLAPPTLDPIPEPTPESAPTVQPFPASAGTAQPQARAIATLPAALEGPADPTPPIQRSEDQRGTPLLLIVAAIALIVAGLSGAALSARGRAK